MGFLTHLKSDMFGFGHSGYKFGCIIVSKKLPFYHWGQDGTNAAGPAVLPALVAEEQQSCCRQSPWLDLSPSPCTEHAGLCALPSCFWGSPSLTDSNELLSCVQRRKC